MASGQQPCDTTMARRTGRLGKRFSRGLAASAKEIESEASDGLRAAARRREPEATQDL